MHNPQLTKNRLYLCHFLDHKTGLKVCGNSFFVLLPPVSCVLIHLFMLSVCLDVNVSVICPTTSTLPADQDSFSYGPHLSYLRLDGNEIKPPVPMDLMNCFRLLQTLII